MARFVIVPAKPTHDMEAAHFEAHAKAAEVFASVPEVWSAIIAAAPALTDDEIDGLCMAMWPKRKHWTIYSGADDQWGGGSRRADRVRMRAFLSRLATPTEENPS